MSLTYSFSHPHYVFTLLGFARISGSSPVGGNCPLCPPLVATPMYTLSTHTVHRQTTKLQLSGFISAETRPRVDIIGNNSRNMTDSLTCTETAADTEATR